MQTQLSESVRTRESGPVKTPTDVLGADQDDIAGIQEVCDDLHIPCSVSEEPFFLTDSDTMGHMERVVHVG